MNRRIDWVDFAKGVGILLVIVGHGTGPGMLGNITRGIIFSFHMPLFFILSSYTFRYSRTKEEFLRSTKKAAVHLLVPFLLVDVIWILWAVITEPARAVDLGFWKTEWMRIILGSGVDLPYLDATVPAFGIGWFFLALFAGRTAFDYVQMNSTPPATLILSWLLSAAGVLFGITGYMPLSLDIALAVLPFFAFGYWLKKPDAKTLFSRWFFPAAVFWLLTLWMVFPDPAKWTYLELAARRYPLYPICFVTAAAGSACLFGISCLADQIGRLAFPVRYLGKNSLYLLIVHCCDYIWRPIWYRESSAILSAGIQLLSDLVVFACVMAVVTAIRKKRTKKTLVL